MTPRIHCNPDLLVRAGAALLLVAALVACGGEKPPTPAPSSAVEAEPAVTSENDGGEGARAIYDAQHCAMCHGENRDGTDMAPPLRALATYWDEDKLVRYLNDPAAFQEAEPSFRETRRQYDMEMPAFDQVPEDDRRRLARWLLTD